jgi:poly-gamma-glutamate synthesis protein (capsule biosynthesis protein)
VWWGTFGFLIIIGAIIATLWWLNEKAATPAKTTHSQVKTAPIQPKSASSNMLFTGNIFFGRYINDWSMASTLKYAYPFSQLSEFHRDQYDAWISGLECPTVASVHMTSAEMEQALQFNCSPNYLPEAARWFNIVTLANNHTDNQGVDGFEETKAQLEKNHIQYFGHYDPRVLDDVCEVVAMPVTITSDDQSTTKGNLPVAMCGYHGVFRIPSPEAVAEMQNYSAYMPVIAMPHMGVEYQPAPDQLKTDFYRSLIDGGADMVIGDHPHWIQNTESYKGHLIVYSMGNFIFDQQDTPEVTRSAAIRVVMKTSGENLAMLAKWLKLGDTCKAFKDDCLKQVKEQGLTKLNMTYQFDAIGTNDGNKIAKPATPAQQADILQRLNWQSTMNQLQAPYSKL